MLFIWLVTLLGSSLLAAAIDITSFTAEENDRGFLTDFYDEEVYDTLTIYNDSPKECLTINRLNKNNARPVLLLSLSSAPVYLKGRFNSRMLIVICLQGDLHPNDLSTLANSLQHMRQTNLMFLIGPTEQPTIMLNPLIRFFNQNYITNVVIAFEGNTSTNSYYRYYPYPNGSVRLEHFNSSHRAFPPHYVNLQRKTVTTLPDQLLPRTVLYNDDEGKQYLSGYIGYLISSFAQKHNATLQFAQPVAAGEFIHMATLQELVFSGQLDFGGTVFMPTTSISGEMPFMSYPAEYGRWLLMLPCPQPIPIAEIFTIIVTVETILLLVLLYIVFGVVDALEEWTFRKNGRQLQYLLLNDKNLRGFLGQSFPIPMEAPLLSLNIVYCCLLVLGFFINSMYPTFLNSLLISPPLSSEIITFEDLHRSGQRLMFDAQEARKIKIVLGDEFERKFDGVYVLRETKIFQEKRESMDTAYGYTVPEIRWPIFEMRQEFFARKVFCLAPTLKFWSVLMGSIPIGENSAYKEPMNHLIVRAMVC
ncbi:uncharacterized protein LOC105221504 [Zeugodacus cucurbitae]|uniref:uncharacterized protein LOC105221504 n=1 Tax=Zeugodacus cucurbitae TaxID=28588 RepID=UPI0023D93B65|nr:uncharacterized protein LOC105221504 [Zeugodacus cucurbitae]